MTLSDVIYLCAYAAIVVGVGLLVGAFLSLMAAIGAALVVLAVVLYVEAPGGGST